VPYREAPPPAPLGALVACTWVNEVAPGGPTRVLPDAAVDVIWRVPDGDAGRGVLLVAGPDTTAQHIDVGAPVRFTGVRFRPGAAAAGLGVPVDGLRDGRVPLAEVWGDRAAERLAERLAAARRPELTLAAAVAERLADGGGAGAGRLPVALGDAPGPAVADALRAGGGPGGVRRLARDLGVSERQLHRRCLAHFGYGPKTVQRVLRFQGALALARAGRPLAAVAAEAGYADQAHLARDVRALAGTTLTALLADA
jgi:AraC-like DNA-binding protein